MAFFVACISEEFSLLQSISLRLKNVVLVYVHLEHRSSVTVTEHVYNRTAGPLKVPQNTNISRRQRKQGNRLQVHTT